MTLLDDIVKLSNELEAHTIEVRHKIHSAPELSYKEFATSKLVCSELEKMGIPYEESPIKPGIIATIDSGKAGKLLLLRADMDALPVQEDTGLDFASAVPNVMHACGHDVHTANLLTMGNILNQTKGQWTGRVKLVFQPAEENGGGGREMIKAGMMEEVPDACLAMHVKVLPVGVCVVGSGPLSAYTDSYKITLYGKAAHSSTPEKGVDAISIAAAVINGYNMMMAKNISPMANSTLNYGTIQGGLAPNILADKVELTLMLRNATKEAREAMMAGIERITKGTAETMGGSCEIAFRKGYDSVYNNEELAEFSAHVIEENKEVIFKDITATGEPPANYMRTGNQALLGGEDFGFYSQKAPSCMLWLGTGEYGVAHSTTFQVEDKAIKFCTRVMTIIAAQYLLKK